MGLVWPANQEVVMPIINWDPMMRLAIACVLGSILGLERELTRHPAGLRTHVLVCMGSTAFVLLAIGLVPRFPGSDPLRVVQGVITGVGFIGAGTIIKDGWSVRGITTAASLWVASGVGLLVAADFMLLAVTVTLLSFVILVVSTAASGKSDGGPGDDGPPDE